MSDLWTDSSAILEDLSKLNHFGPGSGRRTKKPHLKLIDGYPPAPKVDHLEFPEGYEDEYNDSDTPVEPDHELITSTVRMIYKPGHFSNESIEETIRMKRLQHSKSLQVKNNLSPNNGHISGQLESGDQCNKLFGQLESGDQCNELFGQYLNPECEEFKPSGKEKNTDEFVKKVSTLNPLVPEFVPPNVRSSKTDSDNSLQIVTNEQIPAKVCESIEIESSKGNPAKHKKRVNVALQSILQLHSKTSNNITQMKSDIEPEKTTPTRSISASRAAGTSNMHCVEQSVVSKYSLSSISDNEDENKINKPTTDNNISNNNSDDEVVPVNNKCLSWMSSNEALISGKVKIVQPEPVIPLILGDDAFAFRPKSINTINNIGFQTSSCKSESAVKPQTYSEKYKLLMIEKANKKQILSNTKSIKEYTNWRNRDETSAYNGSPVSLKKSYNVTTSDSKWWRREESPVKRSMEKFDVNDEETASLVTSGKSSPNIDNNESKSDVCKIESNSSGHNATTNGSSGITSPSVPSRPAEAIIYPQTPSDLQSSTPSMTSSPPLCKEIKRNSVSPPNFEPEKVYERLRRIQQEKLKKNANYVNEYEKNTLWAAISTKLDKK